MAQSASRDSLRPTSLLILRTKLSQESFTVGGARFCTLCLMAEWLACAPSRKGHEPLYGETLEGKQVVELAHRLEHQRLVLVQLDEDRRRIQRPRLPVAHLGIVAFARRMFPNLGESRLLQTAPQ